MQKSKYKCSNKREAYKVYCIQLVIYLFYLFICLKTS